MHTHCALHMIVNMVLTIFRCLYLPPLQGAQLSKWLYAQYSTLVGMFCDISILKYLT